MTVTPEIKESSVTGAALGAVAATGATTGSGNKASAWALAFNSSKVAL